MNFVQSAPWPFKVALLFLFLYKPIKIEMKVEPEACLHAVALYMMVTCLPSLVYSVRNRQETTKYIQMSALIMMNANILYFFLKSREGVNGCLGLSLMFVCVHTLVAQREAMHKQSSILLLSSMYSHTHVVAMCAVLGSASLIDNSINASNLHTSICILAAVFSGEVLGSIAYLNHILFKTIGDAWEGLWV